MQRILNITMSVDGFIAGPNRTLEQPLGEGAEALHEWMVGLESWRRQHGLTVSPLLLGDGVRLFERAERRPIESRRVVPSPRVTHLVYGVR